VDNTLYATKPDRNMQLTSLGRKQAYVSNKLSNAMKR
jgi:hypothetical protein